ncbi:MAG: NAD(P)-dependent alcohol dehydrogenase [Fibrobacteres bacterium]|nr:NAD(P)-dependent alcohol dehydrogenase [Fibrobacterota bacterium]
MKAVFCEKYGGPDVLKLIDIKKPEPKHDEVLIKIFATSVTNSDLFIRGFNIPLRYKIFMRIALGIFKPGNGIIGEVLSGEIEKVGTSVKRFKVGQKVYGLTGFSLGAYAEYKCMKVTDSKQGCIAIKPDNITHEDATGVAYGGLLALQALEKKSIEPGMKVLIYGASSTTGTIAIQYAKSFGAIVTAVCSSTNIPLVKSLGADKVLDYNDEVSCAKLDFYDIILDAVGKAKTSSLKKVCGLFLNKNGRSYSIDDEALLLKSDRLDRISVLVESGLIKPVTDRIYPLEQIVDAHRYVETGHKKGNVAIRICE